MPDLFEFFKENAAQLHEQPSEQAWKVLHDRLEKQRKRRRRQLRFLQLGAAALTILLLLLAAGLVWYFTHLQTR